MATVPMAKIVLKNTTKMSLNERFTAYRQQAQTALNTIRQKMQTQKQASVENRRLAQQMANRPSVIAALRLKKRSLQQRLGQKRNTTTVASPKTNVKARLSLGVGQNVIPVQNRLGTQRSNRNRGVSSPRRGGRRSNRGAPFRPGTSPMLRARLGTQNQAKYSYGSSYRTSQSRGVGGNYQGGRGSYNRSRQPRNSSRNQFRKNAVGNRSQSRGAGWNRGGMSRKSIPTKQELDNQLDEYMAETKSHLDAQIDQYMAQAE